VSGTTGVTSGTINGTGLLLTGVTTFNGAGNTLSGTVTSTNGVTLAAGAALALNGALTGNMTVGSGTLTGTGSVSGTTGVTGGTINGTGLLLTGVTTFNGAGNTLSGTVTSTNGVTLAAGAGLALNGALTGNLTVGAGTLTGTGVVGGTTGVTGGTINGSGLWLIGVTTFNGAGNTLTGTVTSTNGVTLAGSAALALNGALTGNLTVGAGTLSGTGSVIGTTGVTGGTINGTGLWLTGVTTFNGAGNTLSGTVTSINGVTLAAGADLALNGALTGNLTVGSGTLTGTGSVSGTTGVTGGTINGTGLTLTGVTTFNGAGNTLSGTVTSTNGVTLAAGAGLALNGALTGNLTVDSGTLTGTGSVSGTTGVTGGTINGTGLLLTGMTTFNGAGNTLSGTVTSTNGVTLAVGAALALNGALTGNLTVSAGTLSGTGSVIGTTGVTSGTINGTGLLLTDVTTFNGAGNTLSGTVTSTNGVTLAAGAALALNGALTGTLAVGNGTLTGTGGSVSGATTLNGGTINLTSGTLGGTLGVTGGNWNGAGSVTGLVTSSSGTFTIGAGANLTANSGLNVTGGSIAGTGTITGNVNYTSTTDSTFGGDIAGAGNTLTMNGPGAKLTLTGANTYTGTTTISAGTLSLANAAANNTTIVTDGNTATTSDIVINGGTLEIVASEQIADTGSINMSSGAFNFGVATGLTETIDKFTNSGGTFVTGANTLHGLGATIIWSGGTNTINDGGLVTDSHIVISGGTNTIQPGGRMVADSHLEISGGTNTIQGGVVSGGVLQVNAGGIGMEMSNGATLNINPSNGVAGKLVLNGNLSTSGNVTVSIESGGIGSHAGLIDLGGGTRTITVADGANAVDLLITANIVNGGLIKAGLGTLMFNGTNPYTGLTTVQAGTLAASGIIGGSILNQATVAPGGIGSIGTMTVNGNFTNTATGTIAMDAGGVSHDLLVVGGTAHLGGNLSVTKFGSEMTLGQTIQVIQAGTYDPQGITFTAHNFADLIGFDPATGYITDAGAAVFTKASKTLGNLNPNQTATYLSLYDDAYNIGTKNVFITQTATDYTITRNGTVLNGNPQLVLAELNVEAGAFNAATVNRLSPEVHRGMVDYTEQSLRTHVREGVDAAPIAQAGKTQVFATLHTSTAGAKDAANNASYDTEMYGATVGVRYDITKDFQIGGLVGADEGSIKGSLINTDATGTMFGLFSHYVLHEASKTTLTGSLSYGSFNYDASRQSYGGSAKADGINSDAFEMSLGVRTVSFESGGLRLIPNASVRYIKGSVDGFVEDSGPGAKLRVGSQGISSMLADVGVDIEYKVMEHLTLLGNVSYVTDFLDGDTNISAKFAASGISARPFSVTAPGIDDQGLVLSIGAQYDLSDNARIGVNYRNEFHQSSRDAQTFGIGASFGF